MLLIQRTALPMRVVGRMDMPSQNMVEILLVEDDDDDAQFLIDALEEGGLPVHVTRVENGEEGMEYLQQQGQYAKAPPPDLILLDLFLPRMSGRELLEVIKVDPVLRRTPIVIMSSGNAQDFQEAYSLHANCCVPKPTDQAEFARAVKSIEQFWLNNRTLRSSPKWKE
jgi:two-component system, chemotaxis family, response regulator Rcp1